MISAGQETKSISTGNSADLPTEETIRFPIPAHGSIPTEIHLACLSSTAVTTMMTIMQKETKSPVMTNGRRGSMSHWDVSATTTIRITSHWKASVNLMMIMMDSILAES